jgi:hypothetical protein
MNELNRRIYFESKPRDWTGTFPSVTIHYREGDERTRDLLASKIEDAIKAITGGKQ